MESFRTRMNSVLKRRSSVTSQDKDKSGSERESSRPPSPSLSHRASSLRKVSGDKEPKRRKRLSFSMRARSDTADTQEHSQIAQQVVAAYGEDKPTVDAETLPLDSSIEYSKIGNSMFEMPTPAAEGSTKESTSTVPTAVDEVPIVKVEDSKDNEVTSDAQVEEEKYTPDVIHIAPEADDHRPYRVEEPAPSMPEPMPYQHPSQDAEIDQTKLNTRDYNVATNTSASHSMVNVTVEEAAPSFPEPVTYDTSFNSTSSAAEPSSAPATQNRYSSQPLSAIDELRAKTHPLEDWKQQPQPPKDDVNYDADEYVRVMTLFFLLPAVLFLGIPYLFPQHVLELASM